MAKPTSDQLRARLDEVIREIEALKQQRGEIRSAVADGRSSRAELTKIATQIAEATIEAEALEDAVEIAQRRELAEAREAQRKANRMHLDAARREITLASEAWTRVDSGLDAFVELVTAAIGHHQKAASHLHAGRLLRTAVNAAGVSLDAEPLGRVLMQTLAHKLRFLPGTPGGPRPDSRLPEIAEHHRRKVFAATEADPEPAPEQEQLA